MATDSMGGLGGQHEQAAASGWIPLILDLYLTYRAFLELRAPDSVSTTSRGLFLCIGFPHSSLLLQKGHPRHTPGGATGGRSLTPQHAHRVQSQLCRFQSWSWRRAWVFERRQ
mmetsp:Transcript_29348/g.66424  ORF Transcript_29348/g.66424 Transcript_29348/m.66424 type:complete len:113 (-) Transcript_29348:245-583(-)